MGIPGKIIRLYPVVLTYRPIWLLIPYPMSQKGKYRRSWIARRGNAPRIPELTTIYYRRQTMSELASLIESRRSIRNFQEKDVPEDVLNQIFETIRWTPSWANSQCWEIVVVRDAKLKEALKETMAPKNPATKSITGAPVVLGICGKLNTTGYYSGQITTKFGDWFMFDLGIVTQNICLMAHSMGLGTVVVGLYDHDRAKKIIQVPDGYELVALLPLGYPAKTPPAPPRKQIAEFVHLNTF